MKIALFGATGMIGQRILREAVRRGHTITAIARNPAGVPPEAGVTPAAGNLLEADTVASLVAGHDAVVSAYGPRGEAPETVKDATHALIAGLTKAGVRRLVVVGGAGSLEVTPGRQLVDTPEFPAAWKPVALAHRDVLQILRDQAGDLEWTYFSPAAFIEPGERTGTFRLGGDQLVTDAAGNSRISAEDYAVALLDELERPAHIRQRFTAAY